MAGCAGALLCSGAEPGKTLPPGQNEVCVLAMVLTDGLQIQGITSGKSNGGYWILGARSKLSKVHLKDLGPLERLEAQRGPSCFISLMQLLIQFLSYLLNDSVLTSRLIL